VELVIHPRATADLDDHAAYIAERNEAAGRRFLEASRGTFERLRERPRLGRRWRRGTREMRWVQVSGFRNYLVFYQIAPGRVTIVRVLHGAMDLPTAVEDQ
jgi:plasmid stabilization system protein ParE